MTTAMVRIQLELPREKAGEIERLMQETSISTKKEFFNSALTLLKWAIKARQGGRIIASIDQATGDVTELEMPILSAAEGQRASGTLEGSSTPVRVA